MAERSLQPCPPGYNCVSSLGSSGRQFVEPLRFPGEAPIAWRMALAAVTGLPRTRLVDSSDGYLRAECVSPVLRRIADLELLVDVQQSLIHIRSASRSGLWDLGTNRRRIEALRKTFDAQLARLGRPPGGKAA